MKQILAIGNATELTLGIPGINKLEWTAQGTRLAWAPTPVPPPPKRPDSK